MAWRVVVELFQRSTKIWKDSVALLKEALIMVRNISCWLVVCSLVSPVPQALVEIPADKELDFLWVYLLFFLLVQVSYFGFGVEQRVCKFLVALLLLPKQEAKKKNAENPKGLIRKRPEEEFFWPEDFKIPLSFCLSVYMCVAWVRESVWGDTYLEKVVL